jgi:hypothetical protein
MFCVHVRGVPIGTYGLETTADCTTGYWAIPKSGGQRSVETLTTEQCPPLVGVPLVPETRPCSSHAAIRYPWISPRRRSARRGRVGSTATKAVGAFSASVGNAEQVSGLPRFKTAVSQAM